MIEFSETLPEKEGFYSSLNMKDITAADYRQAKRKWEDFEMKDLGKYHELYVPRDTVLLANISENVRDMCLEIYKSYPFHFLTAPISAWQAALKRVEVR